MIVLSICILGVVIFLTWRLSIDTRLNDKRDENKELRQEISVLDTRISDAEKAIEKWSIEKVQKTQKINANITGTWGIISLLKE